ncbi:hypothetical protein [Streptacidiphilus anmyonensis]|uniref:hypothetical protein n=1 Tax=Streptacidiphilus anmyonensis TaxID=405782 RepID=UPI0005A885A4|nr:hypothetical protein [Streptacidiphilus anmyonensis]
MASKPTPRPKTIRPVTKALILKAKGDDDPVAVFSSSGRLLGIVDPSKITPVSDPDADQAPAKKQPQPTRSAQTEAAAGEDPELGIAKARATALQMKKVLSGGDYTAAEQDQVARDLSRASQRVLKHILANGPRRAL